MSKDRIMVTGACGFIGSHIIEHLLKNTEWDIVIVDRLDYASSGFDRLRDIECFDKSRVTTYVHDLNTPIEDGLVQELGEFDYIVHAAAGSHVDNSITNPVPFVQNNVNNTLFMLEYIRKYQPNIKKFVYFSTDEVYGTAPESVDYSEGDRYNPGNPYSASKASAECICYAYSNTYKIPTVITNCWDMDTKVLTKNGSKSYNEIKEGDLVWTLDNNENLILEPVLKKVKMKGSNTMYRFTTQTMSQLVTPNHRMMFRGCVGKPRRWGKIEETQAENLNNFKGRIRIPLTGNWVGRDNYPEGYDKVWLATVLGWYVSEGYEAEGNGICFGAGTEKQFNELEELLKDYSPRRNGRSVRVCNKELKNILKLCGKYAINKQVPDFVKEGTKKTLRAFFESAMKGDGANLGLLGQEVYYTKSKKLTEDMREIGMKLGYGIRISERETFNPIKTKLGKSFVVRFHKSFTDLENRNIKEESYDGDVWCISVPSGRVFIERDGAVCLTGQTMNVIGERQHPEKYVPLVISKVISGDTLSIHSNKEKTKAGQRHYIHARNVADGLLFVLTKTDEFLDNIDSSKGKFNIVGEVELDNLELAIMIKDSLRELTGYAFDLNYEMVDFHSQRPGHDLRYSLCGDKMLTLGWEPPVGFKDSLKKTIQWYLKEGNKKWLMK